MTTSGPGLIEAPRAVTYDAVRDNSIELGKDMKRGTAAAVATQANQSIRKTQLRNGLVIVSEHMPHVRAVSFGIFLRSGSRHETRARHGLTHFIEHALFKGTERRSAAEVAAETDALGGNLDAFTGREIVGYYNKVLDEHAARAFELLADLVTAPAFDTVELEKERNVIIEEIKMVEDTPDDLIFDLFCETFYPDHPLGRTILGTPATLATFSRRKVRSYYDEIYRPDNFVLAVAGNIEHAQVVELAKEHFGHLKPRGAALRATRPRPAAPIVLRHKPDLEQSHLLLGVPCPSLISEDRYAVNLLSTILGGGMSSRLFQSVREDRGLVYSVFASVSSFVDCGYFNIYAGASTGHLRETLNVTMDELRRLKREPIPADELRRNQDQLKAALVLNLESSSSRMSNLAQQEMNFGRFFSPEEVVAGVESVTAADLQRLANEIFRTEALAATVLGNLRGFKLGRAQLEC